MAIIEIDSNSIVAPSFPIPLASPILDAAFVTRSKPPVTNTKVATAEFNLSGSKRVKIANAPTIIRIAFATLSNDCVLISPAFAFMSLEVLFNTSAKLSNIFETPSERLSNIFMILVNCFAKNTNPAIPIPVSMCSILIEPRTLAIPDHPDDTIEPILSKPALNKSITGLKKSDNLSPITP